MKRLFISLYVLLSLSVLGIGWTLDSLWLKSVEDDGAYNAPFVVLAQVLAQQSKTQRLQTLASLPANPEFPIKLLDADQVALSDHHQLSSDQVTSTPYDLHHELHFIAVGDQVLMAGPLTLDPGSNLRGLYNFFFYLSLAIAVLLWVWPLSKDLKTLRLATENFGHANWHTRIKLNNRSLVQPLAITFNSMAAHISALIENQKHLTNAVSHEIRTPLARLKFALALLPQYCRPEADIARREEFLSEMEVDIKEMEKLLEELLTYAGLESQRDHKRFEQCNLVDLAAQTIKRLSKNSPQVIKLTQPTDKVELMAEPALIERAIQNLITNAQRFSQSAIMVEIMQQQGSVSLSVTDDGEGIPIEDQSKIFEPFYRSASNKNGNKGHGLGLAIIKRIMVHHQGDVSLNSRAGYTQFTLTWPRQTPNTFNI